MTHLQSNRKSFKNDDERVRDFQRKIYLKAKQMPRFRFYILYDKVRLLHFLAEAYRRVKLNKGAPGVDGVTFKQIEEQGLLDYLLDIQDDLKNKTYKPSPVRRVHIPKGKNKTRPLGIPTIRDRIVQMSCKMVIEPIFEADFEDTSFGYRPKKSSQQAIIKIRGNLKAGKTKVYDADLSSFFDTIPHTKLLKLIGMRISDRNILHLIKLWLKAPVVENGIYSGGMKNKVGTPQGGVISPLLANIYLHLVDKLVSSHKSFIGTSIVRYADDFVIMGKEISDTALHCLKILLGRMELTINEVKTKYIDAEKDAFEFLGFTFVPRRSKYKSSKFYWQTMPSKKALKRLKGNIKSILRIGLAGNEEVAARAVNASLRGWLQYFSIDGHTYFQKARYNLLRYLRRRLFLYQKRKSQRFRSRHCRNTISRWRKKYGLINPYTRSRSAVNA